MPEHTPGPWTIDLDYDRDGHHGINSEARMWKAVAECSANTLGAAKVSQDEAEANAHLIAAAPELLEALEEVVAISDRKHNAWDKAHAAIAKATRQGA
jgi:hypothetical protein